MKRNALLLAAALVSALISASCNGQVTGLGPASDPAKETFVGTLGVNIAQMTKMPNGVYYLDLVTGNGTAATSATDTITVNYAGYLKDGKLFDSGNNVKFNPAVLVVGFRTGIVGMKEGGRRKLVIPSSLGFGGVSQRGTDGKIKIPRQSTLIFDVDLLTLHNP